jgi:TonB-linked SusC/RagA family outer membrane protein
MKKIIQIILLIISAVSTFEGVAQGQNITGKVTAAAENTAIPGVNVLIKGTSRGTLTDPEGNYTIQAAPGEVLVFSFIGYTTQEIPVGTSATINVSLVEDVQNLDEVVVTAFGISQEKKALAYAVQEVQAKEIIQAREPNLVDALNSKAAGVQVVRQGGAAGAGSSITIRGNSSISGNNQPLFVVDGIPINNSFRTSTAAGSGVDVSNRAIDINPDDIESMTVLKGPAATALYGIQAGSGVVVITTKKGARSEGRNTRVNFSSTASIDQIINFFPQQEVYAQGDNDVFGDLTFSHFGPPVTTLRYDGSPNNPKDARGFIVDMNDPRAIADARVPNIDNQDLFFQTGQTYNNHLSISSGNKNGSVYFSVGNLNQSGIIPKNDYRRTSFKLTAESSLTDKIRLTGSAFYTNSASTRFGRGDNFADVIQGTIRTPRSFNNREGYVLPNGHQRSFNYNPNSPDTGTPDNPYWTINNNPFKDDVNRLIGYMQANYDVLPWLNVMYRLGSDFSSDKRTQVWARGTTGGDGRFGRVLEDTYTDITINSDLFLTASKQFNDFDLSWMVGHNHFYTNNKRQYISGSNLQIPGLYNISNATESINPIQEEFRKKTVAAFSRINAGWKGIFFLEVSARNEWSSTLPKKNNSFLYGSTSLGFVFTELLGLDDILSFGKLKGSWAQVGRDAPIYATQTYYERGGSVETSEYGTLLRFPVAGLGGVELSNDAGNSELKPEKNTTIEFGTELNFLQNRLGIDFTWYRSLNADQIVNVVIPGSTGFTNQRINSGVIENKGIELVLTGTPIQLNKFKWNALINFTRNRNTVRSLPVDEIRLGGYGNLAPTLREGEPYGVFYGTAFKRNEAGQLLLNDAGYPQINPATPDNPTSEKRIGNPQPDWLMGIRNTFTYSGLSLSFLWDIRKGGDVANVTGNWMNAQGIPKNSEDRGHLVIFKGIRESDGQVNTTPALLNQASYYGVNAGNRNIAERMIEDGSWFRLRDATLTYTFPKPLISKIKLTNLDLSVFGRNLILITNYTGIDPETNLYGPVSSPNSPNSAIGIDAFGTPNTKSYGISLNVTL